MTAKEMFESLGYEESEVSEELDTAQFVGGDCKIIFSKDGFIEYHDCEMYVSFYFDELPAMVQKAKELGWLE